MIARTQISPLLDAQNAGDVLAKVKASGSSFLLGMGALPRERRSAMFGLYAFCRVVDDIADSDWSAGQRHAELQRWRGHVSALFKGRAEHPVMELLLPAVPAYGLVAQDFLDIIEGMEMDAGEPLHAPSWEVLDRYCDRVASAVGRVSMRIFGENGENAREVAHYLGRALQLTNILRDLDEDGTRGRLYLPLEALEEAGIDPALDAVGILAHPALDHACRNVARVADGHFSDADEALEKCEPAAVKPARLMRDYYAGLFHEMLRTGWKNPRRRISLGAWQKLGLLLKAWGK